MHLLDWNSREMYARMLADDDPMREQIGEVCSILCDNKQAKAALKKRRAQAKKKEEGKRAAKSRRQYLLQAAQAGKEEQGVVSGRVSSNADI
jgi:hypothetical protein